MKRAFATLLLLSVAACSVTETGNPSLALTADTTEGTPWTVGPGAVVEHLWVVIGGMHFIEHGECGAPTSTNQVPGPIVVDLVSGDVLDIAVADQDYCRLEVDLSLGEGPLPDGAPAELAGAAFVIEGTTADGAPLRIISRTAVRLLLDAHAVEAFSISPTERDFILSVNVADLLARVALAVTVPRADGSIVISADENEAQLAVVEEDLPHSLHLFFDADGDHVLDLDELATPLAKLPDP